MTYARIIAEHWVCGDGCCSDTEYFVESDFATQCFQTLDGATSFCKEKGWSYVVEDIYPDDI